MSKWQKGEYAYKQKVKALIQESCVGDAVNQLWIWDIENRMKALREVRMMMATIRKGK